MVLIRNAKSPAAAAGQPDMSLIGELLEIVDREPPAIEARKLLIQQYMSAGWLDAAKEEVEKLSTLIPADQDVQNWRSAWIDETPVLRRKELKQPVRKVETIKTTGLDVKPAILPTAPDQLATVKQDFLQDLINLKARATKLLRNSKILGNLEKSNGQKFDTSNEKDRLQAIAEGRIISALRLGGYEPTRAVESGIPHPQNVRTVSRSLQALPFDEAQRAIVIDFDNIFAWLRSKPEPPDNDSIRDTLVKRVKALQAALPEKLQSLPTIGLMHMDHERLKRNYVNDETMLGDPINDIDRNNFFASEDGYAWDMEELAQAITANGGVMRNPLSRDMFSKEDIRFIVKHPMGKSLAAMQLEQSQLSKGIRAQTIEEMSKLATVLLDDQSADQIPSRQAIDEFFAHTATLPDAEQKALDKLKVPARDSHTGQAYDGSIGESLRDALGNRTCMHKTGDFIRQAANHLRKG